MGKQDSKQRELHVEKSRSKSEHGEQQAAWHGEDKDETRVMQVTAEVAA